MTQTFAALAVRNFRIKFFGQLFSQCGSNAQTIALGWLTLQTTHSGTALGLVTAAQYLPLLIAGPLLGGLVDRLDTRKTLIATQACAAVVALVLAVVASQEATNVWILGLLALVFGLINSIDNPAREVFIRELVGDRLLANALGIDNVLFGSARVIGPAIAGFLIAWVSLPSCFYFNAASFVVYFFALLAIRPTRVLDKTHATSTGFRDGIYYVARTPAVWMGLLIMVLVGTFTYKFWITVPMLVDEAFSGSSSLYASLMTVMSIGSVVGGLLIARAHLASRRALLWSTASFGATTALVGLSPTIAVAGVAMFAMGITYSAFVAQSSAVLQLDTEPHYQGRVMALWTAAFLGSTAVGGPFIGWVGESFGPRVGLIGGGVIGITTALYAATSGYEKMQGHVQTSRQEAIVTRPK